VNNFFNTPGNYKGYENHEIIIQRALKKPLRFLIGAGYRIASGRVSGL
jgi:hypothetical protein